ncbi:KR domain-containing protein [Streptomyces sp. NBC_00038]|uniref:KR domain-containing protein n=1 Tax=Streptomyces sp. NBC_00038 TaxID=2903615 RepID=UPI0022505C99|nr:KR domain-containing protein [Streptomyces sp. NBC_00038]MCX5563685.1 KR domain-containing protein [Streptomyces sp. NBC_00038]
MDTNTAAVDRPPRHGGVESARSSGALGHSPVWVPSAVHRLSPPALPAEGMLLVVDGRDTGRAWVPGTVRTVRVGRDVTGSALSWSSYLGALRDAGRGPRGIVFDLPATVSAERAVDLVLPVLRAACCSTGPDPLHLAFLTTGRGRPELAAALGAVAQAAEAEDGRLHAVSVRVEILPPWARDPFHVACAELALPRPGLAEVRHTTAGREIRVLRAHRRLCGTAAPGGLREGGRYLVGGGGDGLGERLALRLVRELGARVVLFGAAPGAGPGEGRLLRVPGRPCRYTDARGAVQVARHALGGLDGVLHCPGGGELRLLARQSAAVARERVADAVSGAAHLDRATAALPLDFFALVTDAAPYQAPAGAAVPAAVARALGSIAATRARLAAAGSRCGASVAVCRPGDADPLGALADALGGARRAAAAPAPRAA